MINIQEQTIQEVVSWVTTGKETDPKWRCLTSDVFQGRLTKILPGIQKITSDNDLSYLLIALTGEIGNNSFDHNLGNWQDLPGIYFKLDEIDRLIILADRGQGVLATIKRVKTETANDEEALRTAFTEKISGRFPEQRGNGLKFVKKIIQDNNLELYFHSGKAICLITKDNFIIKPTDENISGTLAVIKF